MYEPVVFEESDIELALAHYISRRKTHQLSQYIKNINISILEGYENYNSVCLAYQYENPGNGQLISHSFELDKSLIDFMKEVFEAI